MRSIAYPLLPLYVILAIACGSATPKAADQRDPAPYSSAPPEQQDAPETEPEVTVEAPMPVGPSIPTAESPMPEDLLALEVAAYEVARPVFEEYCGACHTPRPKGKKALKGVSHFAMSGYPFGGHHASELSSTIRNSLGATGQLATMPADDPGSLPERELGLVLAWADAFDAAKAANVGHHATSGHNHHHKSGKGKKRRKSKGNHKDSHDHVHKH